jgi:quinol monooxygenase YgiN
MQQLTVVAKITAKKGKEKKAQISLQGLIEPTLKEEGCINYDFHISADNPGVFLFYENWASYDLWQKHMESDHIARFIKIAGDLLDGETELSTWYIAKN